MKVILCGYHWTGCKALEYLIKEGHEIFVYTHENPYYVPSLIELCGKRNIEYTLQKIKKENLPFEPDIIVSIYYRYIISEDIIELVENKIFNLHPSLLPKYKGCSSVTWALVNGEKEYGFTYHYLEKGIDTGRIILQDKIEIEEWDTQQTLYYKVMFESMKIFPKVFDLIKNDYIGLKQDEIDSYYGRGCPHNGEINDEWNIEYIDRFIRAMNNPPLKPATYRGKEIFTINDYRKELENK